ncbi:HPr family phosphocarrier protein [Anaerocolumna sedimenticola]|uniref:HPr family phosphocarrier protein n=1 Tax=Anaerocolumna sedimenticola TaxID=2696063 RepID=A0A6P1TH92_9FIRM|nr:HPr family phosphocarrier protein [Anaerocolumna sedimenticola]QHQ59401.1 HPr family phosphocarrier protein [Anaerocolumna sedimenticola]
MKEFDYTIKDELGIHARPAGMLVKEAGKFTSNITIIKGDKTADIKRLFALMGLGVKNGDTVTVKMDGTDEEAAYDSLKKFFEANL